MAARGRLDDEVMDKFSWGGRILMRRKRRAAGRSRIAGFC
jgi:hypothetical protein